MVWIVSGMDLNWSHYDVIIVTLFDDMNCMYDDNMLNDTKNLIKLLLFPLIFIAINIKFIKLSLICQII